MRAHPLRRVVLTLLAALLIVAPGWGLPAHAADADAIRNLDVSLVVAADGTVDVTYRLDYHFAAKGRHGIKFSVAMGEPNPDDPTTTRAYGVDGLTVTDAAGAAIPMSSYDSEVGGWSSRDLTIGDPNKTLSTQDMTYVVRWKGTGWFTMVDGHPAFAQDITSSDYPAIDAFRVSVTAPSAVSEPTCGPQVACTASATPDGATYVGGHVPASGPTLAVRGGLAAGAALATPSFAPRTSYRPLVLSTHLSAAVADDGSAQVVEDALVVPDHSGKLTYGIQTRKHLDATRDAVLTVEGIAATWDGASVPVPSYNVSGAGGDGLRPRSYQRTDYTIATPGGAGGHHLVVRYTIRGATTRTSDATAFTFASGLRLENEGESDIDIVMPGPITYANCALGGLPGTQVLGRAVHCHLPNTRASSDAWVKVAPGAVPGLVEQAAPSIDRRERDLDDEAHRAWPLGLFGGLLVPLLGLLVRPRKDGHDERFVDVVPGTTGTQVGRDQHPEIPVRFNPPDATLADAAAVLPVKDKSRVLAAYLTSMTVDGYLSVATEPAPLTIRRVAQPQNVADPLVSTLYGRVSSGKSGTQKVGHLVKPLEKALDPAELPQYFASPGHRGKAGPILAAVMAAAVVVVGVAHLGTWGHDRTTPFFVLGLLGCLAGAILSLRKHRPVLSASGTVVRDQAEGFRRYLSSAEADQLRFEEGEDIFSRYLPWAILFDEADRWASICAEASETARAAGVDTSSWSSLVSLTENSSLTHAVSAAMPSTSSSGGSSGGSSGSWSSSSSGGGSFDSGGGGGTSVSSW